MTYRDRQRSQDASDPDSSPAELATALRAVLDDPAYHRAAADVAARMATAPTPGEAWTQLVKLM